MKDKLEDFKKTKDLLICVDSDGCVMDTMDVKHIEVFGPQVVKTWQLDHIKDEFLKVWNDINLYSQTRGINRFKGVVLSIQTFEERGVEMPDISSFKKFTETSDELSNPGLQKAIAETNDEQLKKALEWSEAVNRTIQAELAGKDEPFDGAKEGLEALAKVANVAIVSSANGAAVSDEWTRHDLATYVDVLCGQEAGPKSYCIDQLAKTGYEKEQVMMIGDSPGDLEAAQENEVLFYPILAGKEKASWDRFRNEALEKILEGNFQGAYQEELIAAFHDNLK